MGKPRARRRRNRRSRQNVPFGELKEGEVVVMPESRPRKEKRGGKLAGVLTKNAASLGSKFGSWLGNKAGSLLGSLVQGFGDYKLDAEPTANSLLGYAPGVPQMHNSSNGAIRVTHREYLADLGTGTFPIGPATMASFVINPGDVATFPWLATLAMNFEQWMMLGCVFEFVSTSGDAVSSTNSSLGSMSFAVQYDVTKRRLQTKQQYLNSYLAVSTKPSLSAIIPVECQPDQTPIKPLYVRAPASVTADTESGAFTYGLVSQPMFDPKTYDLGRLEIIGTGSQDVFVAGELWISYDLMLFKPRLASESGITGYTYDPPAPQQPPFNPIQHFPEVPQVYTTLGSTSTSASAGGVYDEDGI